MTSKPSVLVVAPTAAIASSVFAWLTDAGYAPIVVRSFGAGKQYLEEHPALLISEVRLGEYNGLHLALRAQARQIPTVLVGQPDMVLQREAAQLDALYLTPPVTAQELLSSLEPIALAAVPTPRPWREDAARVSFVSVGDRNRSARPLPFRS
jgi:DNA-binding response OmpR family regulator